MSSALSKSVSAMCRVPLPVYLVSIQHTHQASYCSVAPLLLPSVNQSSFECMSVEFHACTKDSTRSRHHPNQVFKQDQCVETCCECFAGFSAWTAVGSRRPTWGYSPPQPDDIENGEWSTGEAAQSDEEKMAEVRELHSIMY